MSAATAGRTPISPDPAMTKVGTYWEYTYVMETNTTIIDVVFNNGAGVWDNNGGNDWHVNVANCGEDPNPCRRSHQPHQSGRVRPHHRSPTIPPAARCWASPVKIHIGYNGWQDVILPNPNMTASGANWTYVYTPPPGTTNINLVFNDGGAVWDNNGGADWHFAVLGCEDMSHGPGHHQSVHRHGGPLRNRRGRPRRHRRRHGRPSALDQQADRRFGRHPRRLHVDLPGSPWAWAATKSSWSAPTPPPVARPPMPSTPPPTPPTATAGTTATTAAPASSAGN
jgi:hypothetical protein